MNYRTFKKTTAVWKQSETPWTNLLEVLEELTVPELIGKIEALNDGDVGCDGEGG